MSNLIKTAASSRRDQFKALRQTATTPEEHAELDEVKRRAKRWGIGGAVGGFALSGLNPLGGALGYYVGRTSSLDVDMDRINEDRL